LRGEPSSELPPLAFVNFLQNHDQIGNRVLGDRLENLAKPQAIEAALAITLLAPTVPMLFMGEEWGSTAPFSFFCDFHGDLAEAVRQGRRREFAEAYAKYGDEIPEPLGDDAFRTATLDWGAAGGSQRLTMVKELLAIRRREIVRRLIGARFGDASSLDDGLLRASWRMGDGTTMRLTANLSDRKIAGHNQAPTGTKIWGGDWHDVMPPWAVDWRIEES
jgi:1,4-alpha-glucan branching enzyme/maltooligosyltrehalose trehalohydrolase